MTCRVTVLPQNVSVTAPVGENLLSVLRRADLAPDAPCGGNGKCGKCLVTVNGQQVSACRYTVQRDMTVVLHQTSSQNILTGGISHQPGKLPLKNGYLLAVDIGTTTLAAYLISGATGQQTACCSAPNPQAPFGADVVSRIQSALRLNGGELTQSITRGLQELTNELCRQANIHTRDILQVCLVGNPAMMQLFWGMPLDNLAYLPYGNAFPQMHTATHPLWKNATVYTLPGFSAFVGADTAACILATEMDKAENMTLLVDIGTNGEMVMGNRHRLLCCSTAAGPALEGAGISCGTVAKEGAIDRVTIKDGVLSCRVIGQGKATGICGSGLIDAVACALKLQLINSRGKVLTADGTIPLQDGLFLTQEDIRQVQLAKGAICAGIRLLAQELTLSLENIQTVYLAGAFGTYLDPVSACRIGLLPPELAGKTCPVGNAAGSGAKRILCDANAISRVEDITKLVTPISLAEHPAFRRCFAESMRFSL